MPDAERHPTRHGESSGRIRESSPGSRIRPVQPIGKARFDRPDLLLGAARLIAAQDPGVWQRLLIDHVSAHDGRCATCRPSSGAAPRWPCRLAVLAAEAQRLANGGEDRR
jgi:hypothetical protein